jgi:hypothetical protein
VQLQAFLIPTIDGAEWLASLPGSFTLGTEALEPI